MRTRVILTVGAALGLLVVVVSPQVRLVAAAQGKFTQAIDRELRFANFESERASDPEEYYRTRRRGSDPTGEWQFIEVLKMVVSAALAAVERVPPLCSVSAEEIAHLRRHGLHSPCRPLR